MKGDKNYFLCKLYLMFVTHLRSIRTNVWLENDSSMTSGIAENSTISSSPASSTNSSVTVAIMEELSDVLRGPTAMVRIRMEHCAS